LYSATNPAVVAALAELVVVVVLVDFVVIVVIVVFTVVLLTLAAGAPKSLLTLAKNPGFPYTWLISHIMTPPNEEKDLQYEMMDARVEPDSYPLPAAVVEPGIPRMTFTFGFSETVFAQLSQVSKLKLFCVLVPTVNDGRPQ
jgi:hypothetical protein